jgi:ribulose-5-phosphate 4-epimerase/fuculose-1-phosphate aldolase
LQGIKDLVPRGYIDYLKVWGDDFSLTQGLGGNCSFKSNGKMLVKSSGKRLSDVKSLDYFFEVQVSDGEYREIESGQPGKPSIEVFLHALLPYKFVVHLHSTLGVALSLSAALDQDIKNLIHQAGVATLGYKRPGIELKTEINRVHQLSNTKAFLLQNHGVVFGAETVEDLAQMVLSFESLASNILGVNKNDFFSPQDIDQRLSKETAQHLRWHAVNNWRIAPDNVVFLGELAPDALLAELNGSPTLERLIERVETNPGKVSPKGEQLLWFFNVAKCLPRRLFPTISLEEAKCLISWESEKHRVIQAEQQPRLS